MKETKEIILIKSILTIISTVLIAIGICLFLESSLGSDPITLWIDGLRRSLNMTMGNASLLNNLVTLALAVLFARKFIHLGTVINAVGIGLLMNLFSPWILQIVGDDPTLVMRVAIMLLGQLILTFGVALNLSTRFGFGTTDALLVRLAERFRLKYRNLKTLADLTYTVAGILLGGVFGVGSLVAVLSGGPLIAYFMKHGASHLVGLFRLDGPRPAVRKLRPEPVGAVQ